LSSGSKKEELYEALLNGLTEAETAQKPILWIASYGPEGQQPSEKEIATLSGLEEEADRYVRKFSLPACRKWAMENWGNVVPIAKESFFTLGKA
jgi:hypothetical protein